MGAVHEYQQWGIIDVPSLMGPKFQKINLFYSSPEYYTEMKYHETAKNRKRNKKQSAEQSTTSSNESGDDEDGTITWSVKKDDFFPYSDCEHCFWTGYFTSRTGLKKLERLATSFLIAARQIEAMPVNTTKITTTEAETNQQQYVDDYDRESIQHLYELEDALGIVQHHDGVSGTSKQHVAND
jgi:alpha-mannosidase